MDKINPSAYITDTDPTTEAVLDASNWYEYQYTHTQDNEQIPWLLAQGWQVYKSTSLTYQGVTTGFWDLKRRVLKPEAALQDLIQSFTAAYNEGRSLNDQRYDEIVALYAVMLDKTEDEINSLSSEDGTYNDLIEDIITSITGDWDDYNDDVDGMFDDYGDGQRNRINTQFDNLVSATRSSLIARGMYNTTVWDSVNAGIEEQRAQALTDLNDKILERQIGVKDRAYTLKSDMWSKILASRDRLRSQLQSQDTERIGLRNQVLSALLSFMERREDGYPDISSIGQLTSNLGATQTPYLAP